MNRDIIIFIVVERSYYAVAVSFQKRLLEVMFDDER
jgi:hypothetical protein